MKKSLLTFASVLVTLVVQAQTNPVDELFNKYSEKQGFTVVTISGRMFSMFADMETGDEVKKDTDDIIAKLKSVRILSVEDSLLNKDLNFYTELSKKLNLTVYEELMMVKEGGDITKFLIKQSGKVITELLVITGGPGGNSLISIKGEFNLKNISDLSKSVGIEELKSLDNINSKSPGE